MHHYFDIAAQCRESAAELRLGSESGIVAIHVTVDGLGELDAMAEKGGCDSATVDVGEDWYILFRCKPEHSTLQGELAEGIEVISEGSTIKLPPSRDSRGDYCCWMYEDCGIADLPDWIIEFLSAPKAA
jgi:hypothetical protein